MTLVEVTVLLAVIGLLVGLMTTAAGDLLGQSKTIRVQEDVEHIGRAVGEFYADNGFFPRTADTDAGRPGAMEIGSLISDAPLPGTTSSTGLWAESSVSSMTVHLVRNEVGYRVRDPLQPHGWNGPYLSSAVQDDSWGHAYMMNTFWLDPRDIGQDADGTKLGAVWVISAGPNGIIETPFYQARDNARLYGDDIGYRLQ
jgi:type II secretory pathway pseudopilin PulG